jgi:hypothetical protein
VLLVHLETVDATEQALRDVRIPGEPGIPLAGNVIQRRLSVVTDPPLNRAR